MYLPITPLSQEAAANRGSCLLVDMDVVIPGTIDETDGKGTFAESASAESYGVVDGIARRALLSGGKVLSVRKTDIPDGKPMAAIRRYAI